MKSIEEIKQELSHWLTAVIQDGRITLIPIRHGTVQTCLTNREIAAAFGLNVEDLPLPVFQGARTDNEGDMLKTDDLSTDEAEALVTNLAEGVLSALEFYAVDKRREWVDNWNDQNRGVKGS